MSQYEAIIGSTRFTFEMPDVTLWAWFDLPNGSDFMGFLRDRLDDPRFDAPKGYVLSIRPFPERQR